MLYCQNSPTHDSRGRAAPSRVCEQGWTALGPPLREYWRQGSVKQHISLSCGTIHWIDSNLLEPSRPRCLALLYVPGLGGLPPCPAARRALWAPGGRGRALGAVRGCGTSLSRDALEPSACPPEPSACPLEPPACPPEHCGPFQPGPSHGLGGLGAMLWPCRGVHSRGEGGCGTERSHTAHTAVRARGMRAQSRSFARGNFPSSFPQPKASCLPSPTQTTS